MRLRSSDLYPDTTFGDGGRYPGTFLGVHSIAVDSLGNIFTTETYEGKRVQKHTFVGYGNHRVRQWEAETGAGEQAWVDALTARADAGDDSAGGQTTADWVAQVCLLKNHATQTMQFCADQAVQILGGMGFMRGTRSERIYREVKVMMIGGGAEEIMKELAARQLGF